MTAGSRPAASLSPAVLVERLTSQLLAGPPGAGPVAVTERILAVQAQDPRGARLAIRARSTTPTAADLDRACTEDRSLVVTWLNRGTLHLVRAEDYPWLHHLTAPPMRTGNQRRLHELGVSEAAADRGVAAIERALAVEGPLGRVELGERVAATGVPTEGQALVHILARASMRGLIVRGPVAGRSLLYVLTRDWLPPAAPVDHDRALAELARRYLLGHGPASDRDLARWSGLPLRDARAGLRSIASQLHERGGGLVALTPASASRPDAPPSLPPPRLLGAFEPVLLGWESRALVVGDHIDHLVSGGVFRPFALVAGHATATWTLRRKSPRDATQVAIEPFVTLSRRVAADLDADAVRVVAFLGDAWR